MESGYRLVYNATPVGLDVKGRSRLSCPRHSALAVLLRHALGEIDGHLGVDQAPVLPPAGPLFRDVHHGQIQHFQQAVIGWKTDLALVTLRSWRLNPSMALVV